MAIKEIPTNFRVYYRLFIEDNKQKLEDAFKQKEELEDSVRAKHTNVSAWKNIYETEFGVKLDTYVEFKENKYTIGKFYRMAKGLFINKQNNYELVTDLFNLYDLADTQKQIHDCEDSIIFYKKCIKLTLKEYTEILRVYYTEVHKKIVLEGQGYAFSNGIGWICVNRCLFDKRHPMLDYAATKKKEKELREKGERIYDKEEAEWCARNGIEYNGKDKRVFVCNEYCYQIPLIDCKLPGSNNLRLEIGDYRHRSLRGKSNDEIIKMCNGNTSKICELPLDLKTKVTLCDKADKILYTKFIRNEAQKPITFGKTNR